VPEDRRGRTALVATLLVAIAAGVGAALAVTGCGGGHKASSAPPATTTASQHAAPTTPSGGRTTSSGRRLKRNPKRAAIERTVASFVEGVERSDAAAVCRLLGRPPGSLEGCARSAGVDLHAVPSSDELSVERVRVAGTHASAGLAGGQTVTLRRAGRAWLVTGLLH
jgi:hypothetical protein